MIKPLSAEAEKVAWDTYRHRDREYGMWSWTRWLALEAQRDTLRQVVEWFESNCEDVTGADSIEQILAIPKYKLRKLTTVGGWNETTRDR